jgi:hypothetical protein
MSEWRISQSGDYWADDREDQTEDLKYIASMFVTAAEQGESVKRVRWRVAAHTQHIAMLGRGMVWMKFSSDAITGGEVDDLRYPLSSTVVELGLQWVVGTDPALDITRRAMEMVHGAIGICEYSYKPESRMTCLFSVRRMLLHALGRTSESIEKVRLRQPIALLEPPSDSGIDWIETSVRLNDQGKKEESLDIIFDTIDDMLLESKFEECDAALMQAPVEELSNPQMLTFLTATAPAKDRLPSREAFVYRVKLALKERGADSSRLLAGLE